MRIIILGLQRKDAALNQQPLWQRRPQASSSADINLRKAQAVVNILLKAIRLGTWQQRHIPGSGAGKDVLVVCVDYGLQGFWPKIYAWLHGLLMNFSIWKVRRFLISIYMLSLTRGRSNSFWIKWLHQKLFTHHQNSRAWPICLTKKNHLSRA